MNRVDGGPLLLIVAGALLLLAVVACLIDEAGDSSRRMKAAFERRILDLQTRGSTEVLRALRDVNDRIRLEKDGIRDQQGEILKSLKRIEERLGTATPPGPGC